MKAICLVAGRSSRLLPLTKDIHKCCLVLRGWTILDWQMACFARAGISEILLVTGHGGHEITRLAKRWQTQLAIQIIENVDYINKNLDFSLFCAQDHLDNDILYFEGDLLVHPKLLKMLFASLADVSIAVSTASRAGRVDTVVRRELGNWYLDFVEHGSHDPANSFGEFICVTKFSKKASRHLATKLSRCSFTGKMRLYEIFSELMRKHSTDVIDGSAFPWIEIDSAEDLEQATSVVAHFGFLPPVTAPK